MIRGPLGGFLRTAGRFFIFGLSAVTVVVHADAWLDAGDSVLRHDVQYLADTGVISLPVTTWPIPSTDLLRALAGISDRGRLSVGQLAVVRRLERRLRAFDQGGVRTSAHVSVAVEPTQLRSFENTPREEGEVGGTVSAANQRFSARLAVAAVSGPDDGQNLRLDGSYLTARAGNWLLTAGTLDRWWGPGWDGSLILSNNARPVPALSLDRESSAPFQSRWLKWIGPWRLNAFMGQMEEDRTDVSRPLLFGMRFTFRPLRMFEASLVRTAQWCGRGRPCDAQAFKNVLIGNDNPGPGEDILPEDEPGNQLAGFDTRFTSPWNWLPLVVYRQTVGEDLNEKNLPSARLVQWGAESWYAFDQGNVLHVNLEYSDTTCSASAKVPMFDCAYRNHLYSVEGYRFRNRPLGHSADGDSRVYSASLRLTTASAWSGSLSMRWGELNRGGAVPDLINTVAQEPTDLLDIEADLRFYFADSEFRAGLGFGRRTPQATDGSENQTRGFIELRHTF